MQSAEIHSESDCHGPCFQYPGTRKPEGCVPPRPAKSHPIRPTASNQVCGSPYCCCDLRRATINCIGINKAGEMSENSAQDGEEPSSMERLWEKAENLLERLSWPIRTSLACFMASTIATAISQAVDLHDAMITARIFAPIAAALCSASTLGASIQTSCLVLLGSAFGGIIGFALGLGANLFPGAH
eukprot:997195-Rhodomonas_salina.1